MQIVLYMSDIVLCIPVFIHEMSFIYLLVENTAALFCVNEP